MRSIVQYIKEDMNDNLFFKIDVYFKDKPYQMNVFNNLLDVCRNTKGFNVNTVKQYLEENTTLNNNFKTFVDFIEDNIHPDYSINRDYHASMYNIVKKIIGNKSEGLHYTNKGVQ